MRPADTWVDYELIDATNHNRLERWGKTLLIRPDPQIIWKNEEVSPLWARADAIYYRSAKGGGQWDYHKKLPQKWNIKWQDLTLIVMLAGFGMFAGNIVGGHYADRFTPERVVRFTLGTACLALVGIFFGAQVRYLSLALMCLTTACLFCVSSPQQLLILENSRGGEMLGAALVQVAFNLGNALGAYVGGLPIGHGLGYEYTALPGAAFVLLGMTAAMIYIRKYPRHEQR